MNNVKSLVPLLVPFRRPSHILNEIKTSSLLLNTPPMQVLQPLSRVSYPASHLNTEYGEMESLPIRSYKDPGTHRTQGLSPNSSASSPSTVHSISIGRSSPPTRQRTPIRHHRGSKTRVQNSARAEAILAYAMGQDAQNVPLSQSAYPPNMYMMPPANSSYPVQGGYHPPPGMQQQQQGGQYIQYLEPNPSTYFVPGRQAALSSIQPPDSIIYEPPLGSNVPAHNWSSSAAAPLPSMSLPSNIFSPSPASLMNPSDVVLASRPKPQCFDHGCNGRQFSTYSNLLRHQREKSDNSAKFPCPRCNLVFTRTTARNGHMTNRCRVTDPPPEARSEQEARSSQAEGVSEPEVNIYV